MVKFFLGEVDKNKPNISEGFEEKLNKAVDYFAKFYGEEYRKQYSEKLNNCTYIFVNKGHVGHMDLVRFSSKLRDEIFKYIKERWNIGDDCPFDTDTFFRFGPWRRIEEIDKLKTTNYDLYIDVLQYFYDGLCLKREFKSFKKFIKSDKLDDCIKRIQNELKPLYLLAHTYAFYCSPSNIENYQLILDAYFNEYFHDYVSGQEDRYIPKFWDNENLLTDGDKFEICTATKIVLKKYFFEKCNNKNLSEQEFNNLSYDELMDALNLREFKNQAIRTFNDLNKIAVAALTRPEIIKQIEDIATSIAGSDNEDLLYLDIYEILYNYFFLGKFGHAFVHQEENEKQNFCVLPQDSENETVVHELNHVATCYGKPTHGIKFKSGVTIINTWGSMNGEFLNEALTQHNTISIDKMMRNDGFVIGIDKPFNCAYNCMAGLMNEFIDNFSELLKAYNGESLDELFDQIGKGNFLRLDGCLQKIFNLTKSFTAEEIDEAIEYWHRIMNPEVKHQFVRDMEHVNISAIVKNPSNEVMKEIKNLKEIYDDILAYQKHAGVQV